MGIIKETKNFDFTIQSKPWSEEELKDFRKLMEELQAKNKKKKIGFLKTGKKIGV